MNPLPHHHVVDFSELIYLSVRVGLPGAASDPAARDCVRQLRGAILRSLRQQPRDRPVETEVRP